MEALTRFVSTMKIVRQRNCATVWIGVASIHVPLIHAASMPNVHQPIMRLNADAWTVSLETRILNAIKFKVVEAIQNVAIVRPVLTANAHRHANAEASDCAKCIITKLHVDVQMDILAMHASAVIHHQIPANQTHAALVLCVNWTVETQSASVQKD